MVNNLQDKPAVGIINGSQLIMALTTFANNKITQSVINNNDSHASFLLALYKIQRMSMIRSYLPQNNLGVY